VIASNSGLKRTVAVVTPLAVANGAPTRPFGPAAPAAYPGVMTSEVGLKVMMGLSATTAASGQEAT